MDLSRGSRGEGEKAWRTLPDTTAFPPLPLRSLMRGLGRQWAVYVGITVRLGRRPPWDHRGEIWGNRGIRARSER